jgi:hypothetical protein
MKIKNTVSMRKETYITAYEAALILNLSVKKKFESILVDLNE